MGEAAKLFTRSLMMGLDSAVRKPEFAEPTAEDIENMPYHEAVEYLRKRDVIKKVDYDKLSDKMKFRAFTASRINDGKLLEKLNAQMLANVNGGKGLKDFLSLTKTDILDKIGMGPNQGWYWETVYRTNAQTAYNVGRAMGFEADKPLALQFVGIDDARQTDVCHSLSGIVRPYGDPFWQSHFPPLHFNCRSTVRAIYDEAELPEEWSGLDEAERPAKGFGSYPLDSDNWWKELDSQVRQAKQFGVQGEIEAAKRMLIKDFETFEKLLAEKNVILSKETINLDKEIIQDLDKVIADIGIPDITDSIRIRAVAVPYIASINLKGELKLSLVYAQEKSRLLEELSKGVDAKIYPANCNTLKGVLYHELFGHGAERFLLQHDETYADKVFAWNKCCVAEKIVKESIANLIKANPSLSATTLREQICSTALETYSEAMAYGLQDVYVNNNKAQPLSKEIKRVTMKYIRETLRRIAK